MRTTISIDDDVLRQAKDYAEAREISLGRAVTELVRRGLRAKLPTKIVHGLHVADLPPDSPPVTVEMVNRILNDEI